MDAWEEALVLHDLQTKHSLDQKDLVELTGYSCSWVSRWLSLIEKMDHDLSGEIMMGTITSSHALGADKVAARQPGRDYQSDYLTQPYQPPNRDTDKHLMQYKGPGGTKIY